ncbi:Protein-lysine N-methyltransferase efm4 [Cryptotrichosporon argae]
MPVTVTRPPTSRAPKEHWANETGTKFHNPWPSANNVEPTLRNLAPLFWAQFRKPAHTRAELARLPRIVRPAFTSRAALLTATWLGHACVLASFPAEEKAEAAEAGEAAEVDGAKATARGVNVLFDPALSKRCSPSQWAGPARLTPVPCEVADFPEIDAIVISHNHYDHLDLPSLRALYDKQPAHPPACIVPLNNARVLDGTVPQSSIVELDWWESTQVDVDGVGSVTVTATPSQHQSARTLYDHDQSLWASYAVCSRTRRLWFGGDTGYAACAGETFSSTQAPVNPSFAEVGARLGPFDLALLPIGAYSPRRRFSSLHAAPVDAVRMFKDVRASKAIGIHWAAWDLSLERIDEPARLLDEAKKELGVGDEFSVTGVGEEVVV